MGKPYSMDLRARVVAAVEGGLSRNEAARRFDIAISTAINWVRRKAETGNVTLGQMGGHKPRSIRGEHEAWLLERIKQGDYTLRGLVTELGARGLKVDYRSVWTLCPRAGSELQKKPRWPASRIVPTSREGARNGVSIRTGSMPAAWSSSMRPGPRPTWRRCGDGRHAACGSERRYRTAAGRP